MKRKIFFCLLVILMLVTLTACSKRKENNNSTKNDERTIEYLLDKYIVAYTNADLELTKEVFPPFYMEYSKDYLTKEKLKESLNNDIEKLGNDFKVTYDITQKEKMTKDELETINNKMINQYKAKEKASECYKLEGSLIFKGSKGEIIDRLSTIKYCKYDKWYLIRIY